jgi:hypothetical protein
VVPVPAAAEEVVEVAAEEVAEEGEVEEEGRGGRRKNSLILCF